MSSSKKPKGPNNGAPYPKLWGGPTAVGESQIRAMQDVDLPYMTKSGPGFMSRKKGYFRETYTTPAVVQQDPFFRVSDSTGPVLNQSFQAPVAATPLTDGSLRLTPHPLKDKVGGIKSTARGAQKYLRTVNWVSTDLRTTLTWVAPGRYGRERNWGGYTQGDLIVYNAIPGTYDRGRFYGFGLTSVPHFSPSLWVNGKMYTLPFYVWGAALYIGPNSLGVSTTFIKIVGSQYATGFSANINATIPQGRCDRYVVTPLATLGTKLLDNFQVSAGDHHFYDIGTDMETALTTMTRWSAPNGTGYFAATGPALFSSGGVAAVFNLQPARSIAPLVMTCAGTGAPTFAPVDIRPQQISTTQVIGGLTGTYPRSVTNNAHVVDFTGVYGDYAQGTDTLVLAMGQSDVTSTSTTIETTPDDYTTTASDSRTASVIVGGITLVTSSGGGASTIAKSATSYASNGTSRQVSFEVTPIDLRVGLVRTLLIVNDAPGSDNWSITNNVKTETVSSSSTRTITEALYLGPRSLWSRTLGHGSSSLTGTYVNGGYTNGSSSSTPSAYGDFSDTSGAYEFGSKEILFSVATASSTANKVSRYESVCVSVDRDFNVAVLNPTGHIYSNICVARTLKDGI